MSNRFSKRILQKDEDKEVRVCVAIYPKTKAKFFSYGQGGMTADNILNGIMDELQALRSYHDDHIRKKQKK